MSLPADAWLNLCVMHLVRLRPDVRPGVLGFIAYALFCEHGALVAPEIAARNEVMTWRQVDVNHRRRR